MSGREHGARRRATNHRAAGDTGALYLEVGGWPACVLLSEQFHQRVAADPVLQAHFPQEPGPLVERFALFLGEALGGPADYSVRRGKTSLLCRHAHLRIGTEMSARWQAHMAAAMEHVGLPPRAQQLLRSYFAEAAAPLTDPLLEVYHAPLELLADLLRETPDLARDSHGGRTLLNAAAREWDAPRVELLLAHGADPSAVDGLGHGPLYHAANANHNGNAADGVAVICALIRAGSNVSAPSGPCRATPLHMAARRGTTPIAQALLAAGADLEARDVKGETPLRRAVNCGREAVVRLLLRHGADARSRDRNGITPMDAARRAEIREALSAEAALRR